MRATSKSAHKSAPIINIEKGDCFNLIPALDDNSIDCVLTDPPYFLHRFDAAWSHREMKSKISNTGVIKSMPMGMKFDPKQGRELEKYIHRLSSLLYPKVKDGAFFLCFSMSRLQHRMAAGIEDAGFEIRDVLIWKRPSQPKAMRLNHFIDQSKYPPELKERLKKELANKRTPQPTVMYEAIILAQKPKGGRTYLANWLDNTAGLMNAEDHIAGNLFDIIDVPRERVKIDHMTPKPLALILQLVEIFSDEQDMVLDPFLGSGTTALACQKLNRHCIGYELNEEHFTISEKRLGNECRASAY